MSDQGRLVAGRYRLGELIGRGGMGTVWRADDELLGRQVAVKKLRVSPQLHDDERERLYERTRREARSAARIAHPNVVVVHDVVEDEGLPCIVMEYVASRTLGDVLKKDGPISPREAARVGRGMVAALRAAHRAGVLHRDVKPANVLLGLDDSGEDDGWPGGRIVLTDFGIASATGTSTLTRTGELIGSFDFLAPERITGGTAGPACDLWALGATLYQAVEGEAPFHRDTPIETAYAIASEPMPPLRRAGALAPLIESLLAKDPAQRMTAEQVERLLVSSVETVMAGQPGPAGSQDVADAVDAVDAMDAVGTLEAAGAVNAANATTAVNAANATTAVNAANAAVAGRHPTSGASTSVAGGDRPPQPGGTPVGGTTAASDGAGGEPAVSESALGEPLLATAPGPPTTAVRRRGRRATAWGVLAAVVAAGLGIAGYLLSHGDQATGADRQSVTGRASPTPSPGAVLPTAAAPTAPAGYHLVHDPLGFTTAVPDGWTRLVKSASEVDWVDPTGKVDLKISVLNYAGPSPFQHWQALEPLVKAGSPDYHLLRMNPTSVAVTGRSEPAAIWEYTWQGQARVWHAIDLGFGQEGGTEYAVYLSAPDAQWSTRVLIFNVAAESFRPESP